MRSQIEQDVRAELQAHLEERAEEYVSDGLSMAEAERRAQLDFGSLDEHVRATVRTHPPVEQLPFTRTQVAMVLYVLTVSVLGVLSWKWQGTSVAAEVEPVLWRVVQLGVVAVNVGLVYWIVRFYGLRSPVVAWVAAVWTLLYGFGITAILDIDNFEGTIHALLLVAVVLVVMQVAWKHVSVWWRRVVLYALAAVIPWSALTEHPVFDVVYQGRCLFVTPDPGPLTGVLQACQQVPLLSTTFFPVVALVVIGVPVILMLMVRMLMNRPATPIVRPLSFAAVLCMLVIAGWQFSDINNKGELDILPWKADIYDAYADALGRSPQDKDFRFYAETRAYLHIERIRQTLYASAERRLKITAVYQEVLRQDPTAEEVESWVSGQQSIEMIRLSLAQSL